MNKEIKKIIIPDGTEYIDDEEFKDYINLEEVVIPNSVFCIGHGAFSGCKSLKKIILSNNLSILKFDAFRDCVSLEEITIPNSLHYIDRGVFSNCRNLKTIHIHDEINYIEDYGFYNCRKLDGFQIPKNCGSLGYRALAGCNKIKEIYIPENLNAIEPEALSLMSSLEKIVVDQNNSKYLSLNDIALIDYSGNFIQYAINSKNKEYTINYYNCAYDIKEKIYNIANYAFAGAKHLEKLNCISSIENIGNDSFSNCPKLKKLNIIFGNGREDQTLLFNSFSLRQKKNNLPFEEIIVPEGVTSLQSNILFNNASKVILPRSIETIDSHVFSKNKNFKEIDISSNIKNIMPNAFYKDTILHIEDHSTFKASEVQALVSYADDDYYFDTGIKKYTKILYLNDRYYIENDDIGSMMITKDEIDSFSNNSNLFNKRPDKLFNFLYNLFFYDDHNFARLSKIMIDPKAKKVFNDLYNDSMCFDYIALDQKNNFIKRIIEERAFKNEILFDGKIMNTLSKDDVNQVVYNYNYALHKLLKYYIYNHPCFKFCYSDNNTTDVVNYCNLLEKYHRYESFLFHPHFIKNLNWKDKELIIRKYNKNLKRMFISSKLLDSSRIRNYNLNDLMKFSKIMGVFSDNEILSQRVTTFITEKIFSDFLHNNIENDYQIVGDDIHRIFNELNPREELDLEFIDFFIDNYKGLITEERVHSGTIAAIYNNFREISKSSSSHKGNQRHLKVTLDKCIDYLCRIKFDHITDENMELAKSLSRYYSERYTLDLASEILDEAKEAPRNIFTKNTIDENGTVIYDNDSSNDLSKKLESGLYYEWLPKQNYENLILGKLCNCCAHVLGSGAGIMKASMVLDNCQNLVIRDQLYEIIAKATLYVNKEEGYAVFNTFEANMQFLKDNDPTTLLDAIIEGTNCFVDVYNQHNEIPIDEVTVGMAHNVIGDLLVNNENKFHPSLHYSTFHYQFNNQNFGTYDGDALTVQKLLIKKI